VTNPNMVFPNPQWFLHYLCRYILTVHYTCSRKSSIVEIIQNGTSRGDWAQSPGLAAGILMYHVYYTLSEAWSGVHRADLMAAQGAFGTDFYDRSILRPKHRAYYRSGRPVIKIGPKGALGSHEIRPIHSAPSLGQSIAVGYGTE